MSPVSPGADARREEPSPGADARKSDSGPIRHVPQSGVRRLGSTPSLAQMRMHRSAAQPQRRCGRGRDRRLRQRAPFIPPASAETDDNAQIERRQVDLGAARTGYSEYSHCAIVVLTQDAPMPYSGYTWRTQNSEYSQEYSEYAWGYSGYSHCAIVVLTQDAHMPYSGYAWRTQKCEYSQEYSEYAWGTLGTHTARS